MERILSGGGAALSGQSGGNETVARTEEEVVLDVMLQKVQAKVRLPRIPIIL